MQDMILLASLIVIGIVGYLIMSKFGIFFEGNKRISIFRKRDRESSDTGSREDPFD